MEEDVFIIELMPALAAHRAVHLIMAFFHGCQVITFCSEVSVVSPWRMANQFVNAMFLLTSYIVNRAAKTKHC